MPRHAAEYALPHASHNMGDNPIQPVVAVHMTQGEAGTLAALIAADARNAKATGHVAAARWHFEMAATLWRAAGQHDAAALCADDAAFCA